MHRIEFWILIFVSCLAGQAVGDDAIDFERQIRPLLIKRCGECHGPKSQKSDLRLDAKHAAFKGGVSGEVIVAGDSAASELIRRIESPDADERMPPESAPLSKSEVDLLKRWIDGGARWPETDYDRQAAKDPRRDHWAFQPIRDIQPPPANGEAEHLTPIDRFVLARLDQQGLSFSPPADRRTLIRRLSFDLLGLPPTPEQIDAFVHDSHPAAYARLVETMLSSPRYGERWAQHWLDVVRYADTHGFEVNTPRDHAWPYRDYVIRSFNEDRPYDQFIVEQLAGDALAADDATGFLVAAAVLLPGQIGKDEESKRLARQDALDEIIVGTSATFLGLTIGCARCHDHKFDPITQRDYYALQAFFAGVEYGDRPLRGADQRQRLARAKSIEPRIEQLQAQLRQLEPLAFVGEKSDLDRLPQRRAPLSPRMNVDRFAPVEARFVRFTTLATLDNNKHEPCIDELEIYGIEHPNKNLAIASDKAIATSSGNYSETGKHQLKHVNDGRYGNERSWISNQRGGGWVRIELPEPAEIDRVVWGRDRHEKYADRLAVQYRIEVSRDGQTWTKIAGHEDRTPRGSPYSPTSAALAEELARLETEKAELKKPQLVYGGRFREPDKTFVLRRGDPEQPIGEIAPAVPATLGDIALATHADELQRRVALARWIASAENPLTARVMANRVWQYHFGQGLVATASDFGVNGGQPTHPDLLDWLAAELVHSGWSVKHLHRLIVTSRTYRQSGAIPLAARGRDDRWLWRFPTRRLEAEAIRDSMLSVSGELNLQMGGPGFSFFKTRGGLTGFPPIDNFGPNELRRMIYAHKIRMETPPVFGAFDCPDAGQAMPERSRSTTAIQALNLFNSRFVIERAKQFAQRVNARVAARDGDSNSNPQRKRGQNVPPDSHDDDAQVEEAFRLALGRRPNETESEAAAAMVRQHGLDALCRVLLNTNEFLFMP